MTAKIFIFWGIIATMTLMTLFGLGLPWKKLRAIKISHWFIILLLPIFCLSFYWYQGGFHGLKKYWSLQDQTEQTKKEFAELGSTQNVITKMKQHLQEHPESAQGWYLLGRLYMTEQDYKNALDALTHAKQLSLDDNILTSYAEASYFVNHQHLNAESKSILKQLIKKNPQQFNALNLLAIDAYENKHNDEAINYWQQILQQLPPQSQDHQIIQAMIQRVSSSHSKSQGIELHVHVSLNDFIKSKITPSDKVFIYAQAVSGPAMPLAVTQVWAKDLPIDVTLNESMSMIPNLNLANYSEVKIIARVSKSGQAIAQTGDLQGISGIIHLKQHQGTIKVIINKAI